MTDETRFLPRLSSLDVLEAVRALIPNDFRADQHQVADSPNVFLKIRTLDHETYIQFTNEERELMGKFAEGIKPRIDAEVAALRRLAPPSVPTTDMVAHPTPTPSPLPDPTPPPPDES